MPTFTWGHFSQYFFPFPFQPVGFVTFDSRSGAEAAKNALNVSIALFLLTYFPFCFFPRSFGLLFKYDALHFYLFEPLL